MVYCTTDTFVTLPSSSVVVLSNIWAETIFESAKTIFEVVEYTLAICLLPAHFAIIYDIYSHISVAEAQKRNIGET